MPHLVYLTAGAAGMFCGSCMHDNALVKAILAGGQWDATLVPTYTPIRTDEENVSVDQVFFGGINVYLQQKLPWLRFLPDFADRWLDQPWLIRRLTAKASDTSPRLLGQLAVSMLQGRHGNQRKEVARLLKWLKHSARPDAILLTNVLIGGCVEDLQRELGVPVLATLQGDDAFLDVLPAPYQAQAMRLASQVANRCDALLVHSAAYADYMANYLQVPRQKMQVMTLGIDTHPWERLPQRTTSNSPLVIGYLARLAPEKGLHRLIDAFLELKREPRFEKLQLRVAGWLGDHRQAWFQSYWDKLIAAGWANDVQYQTDIGREDKLKFLQEIDLLCVPTEHLEPKGLFALEAMAAGVPVVVPARGAFPELIARTGGGELCAPAEAAAGASQEQPPPLQKVLANLLSDPTRLRHLGQQGRNTVLSQHNATCMANETTDLLNRVLAARRSGPGPIKRP